MKEMNGKDDHLSVTLLPVATRHHIYPPEVLRAMVKRFNESRTSKGGLLGLFVDKDYPTKATTVPIQPISPSLASHKVSELKYDEKKQCLIGKMVLLDTKAGDKVREILKSGARTHLIPRGVGTVNKDGTVQNDFRLVSLDLETNEKE